ncbi:MAG: sialate O-acetylesterase [Aquirufa sp.]
MKKFLLIIGCIIAQFSAQADVQLPAIIGDHMVLQQKSKVKLWGWTTTPSETVQVKVSWDTTHYKAIAKYGHWVLEVNTSAASENQSISISGAKNTIQISDVLIGEVWVFSGQSNMEWGGDQNLQESLDEMPNATNKSIRFFYIPKATADYPQEDVRAKWVVCNPEAMKSFSAIGYFFGKKLNEKLGVPMGLINSNWGGTPAEVWVPQDRVLNNPTLVNAAKKLQTFEWWSSRAGDNYNAMIAPILNYQIAGVLWYQGESNVGQYSTYTELMNELILSWRAGFKKNFPFYFAQIAPYNNYPSNLGAKLREAQTKNLALENTAMVVLTDLVPDVSNIHPTQKIEVANRFANLALVKNYGQDAGPIFYPKYDRLKIEKNKIRIYFKELGGKLVTKDGAEPSHLMIAGEDQKFYPAKGKIDGNTLIVSSDEVPNPVAVRYAFNNTDIPNLFTKEGLPVNLFRTDNWEN